MNTAQYREAHRLPRKLSLRAADLSRRASEQGKSRYKARADIRGALAEGPRHQTRTASAEGTRATADFPMVVEARRRGGQGKREAARRRVDERVQELGYHSFGDYLTARQGVPDTRIAAEVGLPRSTVREWRLRLAEGVVTDGGTAPSDTEARDAEIRRLFRDGLTYAKLGERLGMNAGQVRYQVNRLGLSRPTTRHGLRRPPSAEEMEAFLVALRRALPAKKAADAAGRGYGAFRVHRLRDLAFAAAWEQARVLRGRPSRSGAGGGSQPALTAFGETMTIRRWAEDPRCAVACRTLYNRVKAWPDADPETIITAPPNTRVPPRR